VAEAPPTEPTLPTPVTATPTGPTPVSELVPPEAIGPEPTPTKSPPVKLPDTGQGGGTQPGPFPWGQLIHGLVAMAFVLGSLGGILIIRPR
jgi:hypothetical protein